MITSLPMQILIFAEFC